MPFPAQFWNYFNTSYLLPFAKKIIGWRSFPIFGDFLKYYVLTFFWLQVGRGHSDVSDPFLACPDGQRRANYQLQPWADPGAVWRRSRIALDGDCCCGGLRHHRAREEDDPDRPAPRHRLLCPRQGGQQRGSWGVDCAGCGCGHPPPAPSAAQVRVRQRQPQLVEAQVGRGRQERSSRRHRTLPLHSGNGELQKPVSYRPCAIMGRTSLRLTSPLHHTSAMHKRNLLWIYIKMACTAFPFVLENQLSARVRACGLFCGVVY